MMFFLTEDEVLMG